jgi:hypothetical protein
MHITVLSLGDTALNQTWALPSWSFQSTGEDEYSIAKWSINIVASPEKSYDSLGWAQIGLGGWAAHTSISSLMLLPSAAPTLWMPGQCYWDKKLGKEHWPWDRGKICPEVPSMGFWPTPSCPIFPWLSPECSKLGGDRWSRGERRCEITDIWAESRHSSSQQALGEGFEKEFRTNHLWQCQGKRGSQKSVNLLGTGGSCL